MRSKLLGTLRRVMIKSEGCPGRHPCLIIRAALIIGELINGGAASEAGHLMQCPDCGGYFDMRDLGQVCFTTMGRCSIRRETSPSNPTAASPNPSGCTPTPNPCRIRNMGHNGPSASRRRGMTISAELEWTNAERKAQAARREAVCRWARGSIYRMLPGDPGLGGERPVRGDKHGFESPYEEKAPRGGSPVQRNRRAELVRTGAE